MGLDQINLPQWDNEYSSSSEYYSSFGVSPSTTVSELVAPSCFLPHVLLHDQEAAFWNPQCHDALLGHAIEFEDPQDSTSSSVQGNSRLHTTLCEDAFPTAGSDTLRSAYFCSERIRDTEFTTLAVLPPDITPNLGVCLRECITVCSCPRTHTSKRGVSAKRCHTPSHSDKKVKNIVKRRKTAMQSGASLEVKMSTATKGNKEANSRGCHNQAERNYRSRLNNDFGRLLNVLQYAEHGGLTSAERVDESRSHSKGNVLQLARQRILSLETENRLIAGKVKKLKDEWDERHMVDIFKATRYVL